MCQALDSDGISAEQKRNEKKKTSIRICVIIQKTTAMKGICKIECQMRPMSNEISESEHKNSIDTAKFEYFFFGVMLGLLLYFASENIIE
jgi:VIT1/CCC1 family predicted Fe2+/Mn2+ transporter